MPLLILYSLFVILFYQLVFTGWTTEYSFYGVAGVIVASLVFIFAYPKQDRSMLIRFTLFSLMISFALASFVAESNTWRMIDYVALVIFAVILGRIFVKISMLKLLVVIIVISLFQVWVPLSDMGLLSAFSIRLIDHIDSPDKQVPSIPVALVNDPNRPGVQTIITLRGHAPKKGEVQQLITMMANDPAQASQANAAVAEIQHSYDLVSVSPHGSGFKEKSATIAELAQLRSDQLGLIDFPFTTAHFLSIGSKVRMYVTLSQNPGQMFTMLMNPGSMADALGRLSLSVQQQVSQNWRALTSRTADVIDGLMIQHGRLQGEFRGNSISMPTNAVALLGVYPILPKQIDSTPQAVLEGNNFIQIVSLSAPQGKVVGTLTGTYTYPLTRDIVFGDLTGNGQDELMINTIPAQIVQFMGINQSKRLWVSGQSSFRFETVFQKATGDEIIANAPATITTSPTRYLGGYVYRSGSLVPVFRAYHVDLVSLHAAHVTSSQQTELLTSTYAHQKIMLLAPTRFPWLLIVEIVYGLLVLLGIGRRIQKGVAK